MVLALNCAQVEGSVAYGLTAALYGECTVEQGRMTKHAVNPGQIAAGRA